VHAAASIGCEPCLRALLVAAEAIDAAGEEAAGGSPSGGRWGVLGYDRVRVKCDVGCDAVWWSVRGWEVGCGPAPRISLRAGYRA
jgi:hypothetical protein